MYKALIIDDEKPVRQVITALGNWKELNIEGIYEAMEGQSGLQILREHKPDIVLVDMKMPVMDGVEFLKAATEEFPEVKYIVISGYDDFEYTKQAIKAKVLDYLLKPVIESELQSVLEKAVRELSKERRRKQERIVRNITENVSRPLLKEKIVMSMIEGNVSNPILESFQQYFDINGEEQKLYGIVILSLINFKEVCSQLFNGDTNSAFFAFTNVIDELCRSWCDCFSFRNSKMNQEIVIVLAVPYMDQGEAVQITADRMKLVTDKLRQLFGIYAVVCVGKYDAEFKKLDESYKYAGAMVSNINLLDQRVQIFTEFEPEIKLSKVTLMDKKELLIQAFETGSLEYARKILAEYFSNMKEVKHFTLSDLQKMVMEFVLLVTDIAEHFEISDAQNLIPSFRNENVLSSFTKLEDFREYVYNLVEKVYDRIKLNLKASEKANIFKIKEYIDRNYYREIKLSMFSERYYLSKEYLSKLFKDEFGYNIYEYVLRVRMEKAGEMLSDPGIRIQSVSERVGYNDNNYFSRAFKNYYGISPSEYRESKMKKER